MQFILMSDTHGHPEKIHEVIRRSRQYDGVFFLGDGLRDIENANVKSLYAVKGNCDMLLSGNYPEELILNFGGKRIMLCHGHKYSVKSGLTSLIYACAEKDIDIGIFGHTHEKFSAYLTPENYESLKKPLYLFNPGSLGSYEGSFGRLDITDIGQVMLSHGEL